MCFICLYVANKQDLHDLNHIWCHYAMKFSGNQPCKHGMHIWCFRDCLHIIRGWCDFTSTLHICTQWSYQLLQCTTWDSKQSTLCSTCYLAMPILLIKFHKPDIKSTITDIMVTQWNELWWKRETMGCKNGTLTQWQPFCTVTVLHYS
jgi:hypothetical protein